MLTDREIVAAMQEANPLPEPHLLPDDAAGFDILLEKISERRVPMLSTPESRTEEAQAIPSPTPSWNRRPLVVLASFIMILVAVGIGALISRGGGSDSATPTTELTTPSTIPSTSAPSSTVPSTTVSPDATPSTIAPVPGFTPGVFVTYGAEQGVPDECAYSIAFTGTDVYLAGKCGLLHFDGTDWHHLAELSYPNLLLDLAVAPDGTVWVANIDSDVLQWTGREFVEYDFRAIAIEVTSDGTVWALQYPRWDNWEAEKDQLIGLWRFDGSQWTLEIDEVGLPLLAGADGSLWVDEVARRGVTREAYPVLKSFDGSSWTTHDTPANYHLAGIASDGSVILTEGHTVPVQDGVWTRTYALQDGDTWAIHDLPTLEELGIPPIHDELGIPTVGDPDEDLDLRNPTITEKGTLWGLSYYGAFSFDGDEWTRYTSEEGLASNKLVFVEIGPDGSLWFGTEDAGVTRYLPEQ